MRHWGTTHNRISGIIGSYLDYGCMTLAQFGDMFNEWKLYAYVDSSSEAFQAFLEVAECGLEWFDTWGMTQMVAEPSSKGKGQCMSHRHDKVLHCAQLWWSLRSRMEPQKSSRSTL